MPAAEAEPGEPETADAAAGPTEPASPVTPPPTAPTTPSRALTVEPEPAPEPAKAPEATAPPETAPAPEPAPAEAVTAEPAAPEPLVPARSGIRYAGGSPRLAASLPPGAGSPPPPAPETRVAGPEEYWDSENGSPFAGLVYSAREDGPDDGAAGEDRADGDGYVAGGQPAVRPEPPEAGPDAPPLTAPLAAVPGLNRVRSMPAPPTDDE